MLLERAWLRTTILALASLFALAAQPPPPGPRPGGPPGKGGPEPPGGPAGVRARLARINPADDASRTLLSLARLYLGKNETERIGSPFAGGRYLAAADALMHAAEHQEHNLQKSGPEPPDAPEISRHLERVYFRLQQAGYFVAQSADPNATTIANLARQYYQQALRASDNRNLRSADECAKTVDELMRALENLAQATATDLPPNPRLGPGPHPR